MKKCFSFFAAAIMACCATVSCKKDALDDNGKGNGGDIGGGETPDIVDISIDGDFSDWDAITQSSEDGTVYFCATGADGYKNIRNLKATSDADYIYMYFEVAASKIYMGEGGHHGDSWEGIGTPNAAPAPIWIYIDSDNNPSTGLRTHWIGDIDLGGLAFSDFMFDNGLQIYSWIATETGLWDMGWQQSNVKLDIVDDGTSIEDSDNYKWKTDDYPDGYGWNHLKDNTIITFENFKTKISNGWAICEFAIDRTLLVDNMAVEGPDMTEIAFGVANQCTSAETGKGGWSGIIPGDRKPAVLKLVNR